VRNLGGDGLGGERVRLFEGLQGGVPALLRGELGREALDLGLDLGAVAGGGEGLDGLGERLGAGGQVQGLAVGQVAQVHVLPVVERDQVLELAEDVESASGAALLAGLDGSACCLGSVGCHAGLLTMSLRRIFGPAQGEQLERRALNLGWTTKENRQSAGHAQV
jgi:hypothetical protein